jgi:hypothetical protein
MVQSVTQTIQRRIFGWFMNDDKLERIWKGWSWLNRGAIPALFVWTKRDKLTIWIKHSMTQTRFVGLEYPEFKIQQKFISSPDCPDEIWGSPTEPPKQCVRWVIFLEVRWSGREADSLLSSTTEVRNEWSYNFSPPIHLHALYENKFSLTFCILRIQVWSVTATVMPFRYCRLHEIQ